MTEGGRGTRKTRNDYSKWGRGRLELEARNSIWVRATSTWGMTCCLPSWVGSRGSAEMQTLRGVTWAIRVGSEPLCQFTQPWSSAFCYLSLRSNSDHHCLCSLMNWNGPPSIPLGVITCSPALGEKTLNIQFPCSFFLSVCVNLLRDFLLNFAVFSSLVIYLVCSLFAQRVTLRIRIRDNPFVPGTGRSSESRPSQVVSAAQSPLSGEPCWDHNAI